MGSYNKVALRTKEQVALSALKGKGWSRKANLTRRTQAAKKALSPISWSSSQTILTLAGKDAGVFSKRNDLTNTLIDMWCRAEVDRVRQGRNYLYRLTDPGLTGDALAVLRWFRLREGKYKEPNQKKDVVLETFSSYGSKIYITRLLEELEKRDLLFRTGGRSYTCSLDSLDVSKASVAAAYPTEVPFNDKKVVISKGLQEKIDKAKSKSPPVEVTLGPKISKKTVLFSNWDLNPTPESGSSLDNSELLERVKALELQLLLMESKLTRFQELETKFNAIFK